MNENAVKIANEVGWVATMGMLTYLCCKMINKFGKQSGN